MTAVNEVMDLSHDGEVAVLTLDAPPVNALSLAAREGLFEGFKAALASDDPPPLPAPLPGRSRSLAFRVAPSVIVAERASTRTTVVEVNALKGTPGQGAAKPLATVKGTLWAGFILAVVYYAWFEVMR